MSEFTLELRGEPWIGAHRNAEVEIRPPDGYKVQSWPTGDGRVIVQVTPYDEPSPAMVTPPYNEWQPVAA